MTKGTYFINLKCCLFRLGAMEGGRGEVTPPGTSYVGKFRNPVGNFQRLCLATFASFNLTLYPYNKRKRILNKRLHIY